MTQTTKPSIFIDAPETETPSTLRSIAGAFPRGALETYQMISKLFERDPEGMGPVRQALKEDPELLQREGWEGIISKAFREQSEFQKRVSKGIEKALPIDEEGDISQFLRGFGSIAAVPVVAGEMGLAQFLLRGAAASASSTLAKRAGLGPVGQAVSELPAWTLTPAFASKLVPPKGLESTFRQLEAQGLSPEAITRSTQSRGKSSALGRISTKGEAAQQSMRETQEELGEFYRDMRALPEAKTPINQDLLVGLIEQWTPIVKDMPAVEKDLIQRDLLDLFKGQGDADSLMSFWKKLNNVFKGKGEGLQKLKTGITDVLYAHDPALGERFEVWNNLYSHFATTAKQLSPSLYSEFFNIQHGYDLAKGIWNQDSGLIKAALTAFGIGKSAEKLLTSPRLYNLAGQVRKAAKTGSPQQANRLTQALLQQAQKDSGFDSGEEIPELWEPKAKDLQTKTPKELPRQLKS